MRAGILLSLCVISSSSLAGGSIVDQQSKLAFTYDNVTHDVAQAELAECQSIAYQTQSEVVDTQSGSAVRGAAKGAAAGAAVGAISGNSGTDGAKIGAAIGVVKGRRDGKRHQKSAVAANQQQYATVVRNCMVDKKYVALN